MQKHIFSFGFAVAAVALVAGLLMPPPADAKGWCQRYGVNGRQRHQQQRLTQGLNSGQLTPREYGRLERSEGKIAAQERRFRQSGGMQPWERAKLEREQSHLSKRIHNQKHDGQVQ